MNKAISVPGTSCPTGSLRTYHPPPHLSLLSPANCLLTLHDFQNRRDGRRHCSLLHALRPPRHQQFHHSQSKDALYLFLLLLFIAVPCLLFLVTAFFTTTSSLIISAFPSSCCHWCSNGTGFPHTTLKVLADRSGKETDGGDSPVGR